MAAAEVDFHTYKDALIILGTAGVVVPLAQRAKLSPVLSFLLAGVVLGPLGLGQLAGSVPVLNWVTVTHQEAVAQFAELGVVFLLFLIGLEMSLPRLLTMRRMVFGLGALQVLVSGMAIGLFARAVGLETTPSLLIGAALALSSTAIVIELLARQGRMASAVGRTTFSVLLFQDLAVVPLLFLVGILARSEGGSLASGMLLALVQATVTLTAIIIVGRLLLQPVFRSVAAADSQELFIAATLFVAVGTSLATAAAGMSMALGAFVAGLLLAETEYRKAIEATIEPVKSLLLGVFFFSVGMSLDVRQLLSDPLPIVGAAAALIAVKAVVMAALAKAWRLSDRVVIESGLLLAPGGEFAFVVLGLAMAESLVPADAGRFTLTVVALTMALIPGLAALARSIGRNLKGATPDDPALKALPALEAPVRAIVIGQGRVGRLTTDMLEQHNISYLATERDPVLVSKRRREGKPVYFGDARQAGFLSRCGIDKADAIIITTHELSGIDEIVQLVRNLNPKVQIISRARDAAHATHLYDIGVTDAVPETIEASLQLSEAALIGLQVPAGPVIASIHEKRDEFRQALQRAALQAGQTESWAVRPPEDARRRLREAGQPTKKNGPEAAKATVDGPEGRDGQN